MSEPRAANLGLARPPLIFLLAILLGVALDAALPLPLFGGGWVAGVGALVAALAVVLFVSSLRRFSPPLAAV